MKLTTSDTFEPSGEPVREEISRLWVSFACVSPPNKKFSPLLIYQQQLLTNSQLHKKKNARELYGYP
ncbi:MAG: hypothetical protein KDE51_02640, partial [Anaerolineales bacterium]|nr:hypothetical protein [Anaerolineales bacterium]